MQCPTCKVLVPDFAITCAECGSSLPRPCPGCGHSSPPGAKFCPECGASIVTKVEHSQAAASSRPTTLVAPERRQVTILFCDMVGSSALSTRLDPEEQAEVIAAFHSCCAGEIKAFDGMVAQYLGDGVLAYFGYPAAHEDDAERAVRAGLSIIDAVRSAKQAQRIAVQVRIGIATGVVVIQGITQENAAIGETTNLAARLQSLAVPNSIVISPVTHRLVGALFDYRDFGRHTLKGFPEAVHVRQVVGLSKVDSRFEAHHQAGTSPLLGRETELELLLRRWGEVKGGDGGVILLTGEPGIGKSRVVRAFRERLRSDHFTALSYYCSPLHQSSALYPHITQLSRAAGFERDDSTDVKLDKLQSLLAQSSSNPHENMALFAALLSIPGDDRYPMPELTSQRRKERTLAAIVDQLKGLAATQPILVVYEDLHWIDPTSLELLCLAIEQIRRHRILLIITARPEFTPPWTSDAPISTISLNRFGRSECEALIEGISKGRTLPADVRDQIVGRTDGVPLFVEELTKTVLESGLLRELGDHYELAGPLSPLAIPSTLHASLLARLDRLAAAKDVAQIGAAIGREFSYGVIAAVATMPEKDLKASLSQLADAELIFQRGVPPQATYQFKHALVQDAAYTTLLRSKRQKLHGRIAHILQEQFSEIIVAQPELLARHFTEAGLLEHAIVYWQRAGERATERSANLEAIEHLQRGLAVIETFPDRSPWRKQELRFLTGLGAAMMTTRSSGSPEIARVYARARQLAVETGLAAELCPILFNSCLAAITRGDFPAGRRLVEELSDLARGDDDSGLKLQAHHAAWDLLLAEGELREAERHIEAGLSLYRRESHGWHARVYGGHDPGACCQVLEAFRQTMLGYPDLAVGQMTKALALARDLTHPPTLVHLLSLAAELHQVRCEPLAVEEIIAELLPLVSEYGSPVRIANAAMLRGWARTAQGKDDGLVQLQGGLVSWRATGSLFNAPYRLALASDAYRMAGIIQEALHLVTEAMQVATRTGYRWSEAELHRLHGELALRSNDQNTAEVCFKQAIATARAQSARLFELRAATSLSRHWRDQGRKVEARDLLAPVYGWFSEGFDTTDLKEAKALLDKLST
jgi:class 3 adenylate cyclase/predicted ATPase